ncbi:MAG: 6,7-dimethyl-8-ribityllumazine synthase [Planctomycetes bacterium]|nr:6,7-dimethyl-8-ribityllumazine synthase [Planctomycetota bacterium]
MTVAIIHEGEYRGEGRRFAIIASRFNSFICDRLIEGAEDALRRHGVAADALEIFRVPGAYEIPPVAARIAALGRFDGIICLGAVIRGATPHFEYVAAEAAKGIAHVALTCGLPVIFGIVTADTIEQAIERAGTKAGNRGADAALAALEMADLYARIGARA